MQPPLLLSTAPDRWCCWWWWWWRAVAASSRAALVLDKGVDDIEVSLAVRRAVCSQREHNHVAHLQKDLKVLLHSAYIWQCKRVAICGPEANAHGTCV